MAPNHFELSSIVPVEQEEHNKAVCPSDALQDTKYDHVNSLPTELLNFIFRIMDNTSLAAAKQVCRRWKDIAEYQDKLRTIDLGEYSTEKEESLLKVLENTPHVKHISCKNMPENFIYAIKERVPKLMSLDIETNGVAWHSNSSQTEIFQGSYFFFIPSVNLTVMDLFSNLRKLNISGVTDIGTDYSREYHERCGDLRVLRIDLRNAKWINPYRNFEDNKLKDVTVDVGLYPLPYETVNRPLCSTRAALTKIKLIVHSEVERDLGPHGLVTWSVILLDLSQDTHIVFTDAMKTNYYSTLKLCDGEVTKKLTLENIQFDRDLPPLVNLACPNLKHLVLIGVDGLTPAPEDFINACSHLHTVEIKK